MKNSRLRPKDTPIAPEDFQLVMLDPSLDPFKAQKRRDPDLVSKLIDLSRGASVKLAVLRKRKRAKPGHGPIQLDLFDSLL